jgi:UDP-2,3-diacylglucosamine hydrolase
VYWAELAEIRDSGIQSISLGNHDLWMEDYFKELNILFIMIIKNLLLEQTFLGGHGDGKGPGDKGYKENEKVFTIRKLNGYIPILAFA